MGKKINMDGRKFGRLTVIADRGDKAKNGTRLLYCSCDCGKNTLVRIDSLRSGKTRSCGCLIASAAIKNHTKHNLHMHPLYRRWTAIKQRCRNNNTASYRYYGGRGIDVCDEWYDNFIVFYKWAMRNGYKKELQIDRIDNDKGYCPENCRFVTNRENALNKGRRKANTLSGYIGVYKSRDKWSSKIRVNGKDIHLGLSENKEVASNMRDCFIIRNNLGYQLNRPELFYNGAL